MDTLVSRLLRFFRDAPAVAFFLALAASGLGLLAVVLAITLRLEACHLCIFQRLVCFLVGASFFIAFAAWDHFALRFFALAGACLCSTWGAYVAAQQSWLQWFPASDFTCSAIEPSLTERLVDCLGELAPTFFMATGSCGSEDLVVFGLTLANWSFLFFSGFLAAGLGLAFPRKMAYANYSEPRRSGRKQDRASDRTTLIAVGASGLPRT